MMKQYSVVTCLVISILFMIKAAAVYPGGSLLDKNTTGFGWSMNFMSNLFEAKAINGLQNASRIWAIIGMAFYSLGYGLFFIHMSKKITSKYWTPILKLIGATNFILIFLIATPLHDIGVLSIILTLIGLFTVTIFILKSKLHVLKYCCIICLLTYYVFFAFFGFGYLGLAFIMQKVYIVSSMLLVVAIEHWTKYEDFMPIQSAE